MEENNDDELAPMVDGLSGALCVLILITTVFMISATDVVVSGITKYGFNFKSSVVNLENNMIVFEGGVRLSHHDIYRVREDLNGIDNPTLYIYIPESIRNNEQKMVFNLAILNEKLNLDYPIDMKYGNASGCDNINSCIYWR